MRQQQQQSGSNGVNTLSPLRYIYIASIYIYKKTLANGRVINPNLRCPADQSGQTALAATLKGYNIAVWLPMQLQHAARNTAG